ncbi:MAG: hypothetical protein ACUVQM_01585 [Candidatus Hadarchaeaceae archaeon]
MKLNWPPKSLGGRSLAAIPLMVTAILLLAIMVSGLPLGRDFNGGTLVMVRGLDKGPDLSQVGSRINELTGSKNVIRATGDGFDIEMDALSSGLENEIKALLSSFGIPSSLVTISELGPEVSGSQYLEIASLGLGTLILMGVVIFIFRRRLAATSAVIVAVLDLVGALGLMAIFRVPINLASILAILIIFVYVVDVNVFLAFKLLKGAVGEPRENISESMRACLTWSAIAIIVLLIISFITTIASIKEFALTLVFGIAVNFLNTWFFGISLYLRHIERKKVVSYHVSI